MRLGLASRLITIALLIAGPAGATEDCASEKPQPNVRRAIEKQAARLLAPDVVDKTSLWFCAYGGSDAEAVLDAVPRRLPDGSDLVRQAWCQRSSEDARLPWKCRPGEYRKTDVVVSLGDSPARFIVVLGPDVAPDVARQRIEQALAMASQVTTQNRCAVTPTEHDLQTFRSDFATQPTADNSTFAVHRAPDTWQVNRKASSVTFVMPEGGEPELKCWAAAWDQL